MNQKVGVGGTAVLPRPKPRRLNGAIRITVTLVLAVHVLISAWLVAAVNGQYVDGKPSPTEFDSLVAIDAEETLIDVEIKNATPFFFYLLVRDGDASVLVNNSTSGNEFDEEKEEIKSEPSDEDDWLAFGRNSVKLSLMLLVLSEFLMLLSFRWRHHLRTLAFILTILSFAVIFPTCYMLDLSGGESEDSTATNTPGAEIDSVSFAHTNASSDFSVTWLGIQIEADFSGYDLGLVDEENRTKVLEEVPENGSKDASSFISFESTFEIKLGKNLDSLLVLPFMWFLLPSTAAKKSIPEEE